VSSIPTKDRKTDPGLSNNNHSHASIQYQHTNTSLQNNIPHFKHTPNIQIYSLQYEIRVSKVHCGSDFEPGDSGLPYYCTAPVCVPDVIGALGVWWHNNKKTKTQSMTGPYLLGGIEPNKRKNQIEHFTLRMGGVKTLCCQLLTSRAVLRLTNMTQKIYSCIQAEILICM